MTKKGFFLLPIFLLGCVANTGEKMQDTHKFTKFSAKYKICTIRWVKMIDGNNLILGIDMKELKDNDPAMAWLTCFCATTALYLSDSSGGESMTIWAVPGTNRSNDVKDNCFFRIKGIWKGTDMWLELKETKTNIYDLCFAMKKIHNECYNEKVRRK